MAIKIGRFTIKLALRDNDYLAGGKVWWIDGDGIMGVEQHWVVGPFDLALDTATRRVGCG